MKWSNKELTTELYWVDLNQLPVCTFTMIIILWSEYRQLHIDHGSLNQSKAIQAKWTWVPFCCAPIWQNTMCNTEQCLSDSTRDQSLNTKEHPSSHPHGQGCVWSILEQAQYDKIVGNFWKLRNKKHSYHFKFLSFIQIKHRHFEVIYNFNFIRL